MMRLALDLSLRGQGMVEPNPMVGAVIEKDGVVIGVGWHEKFGGHHAEVHALNQAGENARGSTLHVTLEPCCHHGKTPPCVDAIIRSGVKRVVYAMQDPNPLVAGKGIEALLAHGIQVVPSELKMEAEKIHAPFAKRICLGMPFVIAKWAMTLDGKIANRNGESKWISNDASRKMVHELRGRMDAILVGIGTVLKDDPMLTARPPGPRVPWRIVLDSSARIPLDSQLVKTAREAPTLVVVDSNAPRQKIVDLENQGVRVLQLLAKSHEDQLFELLKYLGKLGHQNLLVEGGAKVLGSFWDARLVDECHVFIAPKLFGGEGAPSPIGGLGSDQLHEMPPFLFFESKNIGSDVYFNGRLKYYHED